jgi:hypothetical protein
MMRASTDEIIIEIEMDEPMGDPVRDGVAIWYVVASAHGDIYEADDVHRWIDCLATGRRPTRADTAPT